MQSTTSQIFGVVGPLGENLDVFSPLRFHVQSNSDHKTPKLKIYTANALKRYLNEKNLINGRVINGNKTTISKFSAQIFKTYFS